MPASPKPSLQSSPLPILAFALAFALPAFFVTNESFQPIDERIRLEGRSAEHAFEIPTGEPIFFEYGVIVRAAEGPRPTIAIDLNGTPAAGIATDRLFATTGGKVLLPVGLVRPGRNVLRVSVEGAPAATFELGGRIQNYFGIAPDFPRIFVVADDAVSHVNGKRSVTLSVLRFGAFLIVGGLIASALTAAFRGSGIGRVLFLAPPSIVPWILLAYSFATPLHVWLSLEALAVAAALGWVAAVTARWIGHHRLLVLKGATVALITFAALEASLRLFHRVSPSFIFYSDPAGRYRGQPGAPHYGTRLNSRGFNDIDHATARPPSVTRRIVALGDSFAMGSVPYPANYLTLLESTLAPDGSVEVVNMGVSGTDPVDYLSMLVQEGLAFGPDLVLVNFFVGNDFESRERRPYEYSFVATFVHALWQLSGARSPGVALPDGRVSEYRDDEPSMTLDRFLGVEVDRSWVYVRTTGRLAEATARAGEYLRAIRDISRRAGADIVVVVIPDEVQVNADLQTQVVRSSGYSATELDFDMPNRAIAAELAADGIPMLDLLSIFQQQGRATRLYKPQDTHWNIAGNRVAAESIAAFLRDRLRPQ